MTVKDILRKNTKVPVDKKIVKWTENEKTLNES